jgi:DNA-3-methyladenine glycosylase
MIFKKDFYNQSAVSAARNLLGCYLARRMGDVVVKAMIVETEAYEGFEDRASHASRGMTPRNAVMFGEPGRAYVYFTYGMHYMFNIVTGPAGYPAAVLIRAAELNPPLPLPGGECHPSMPLPGGECDSRRRQQKGELRMDGPARLTKALGIDKSFNGLPVYAKKHGLWVEAGSDDARLEIVEAKRVGVDYADEWKERLWRFYVKGNGCVSKK